ATRQAIAAAAARIADPANSSAQPARPGSAQRPSLRRFADAAQLIADWSNSKACPYWHHCGEMLLVLIRSDRAAARVLSSSAKRPSRDRCADMLACASGPPPESRRSTNAKVQIAWWKE